MLPTRRDFLACGTALAANAAPGYHPTLAAQGYIWVQHFRLEKKPLDVAAALAATRRAGFRRVELPVEFMEPNVRGQTLHALRKEELKLAAVSTTGPVHEPAPAEKTITATLELARTAKGGGAAALVFNAAPKPKDAPKSEAELAIQARSLDRLGAELNRLGLKLMIHQHSAEMAANAREWRYDLRHTDPRLVSFCVDVAWVRLGGQDTAAILREAGPRLAGVHLRNLRGGIRTEAFGDGDIDYRAVARDLRAAGFRGFLVVELGYQPETKLTRSIEENLRLSRLFTQQVFAAGS
ncbi:MAG: sugar phosphate isomerase/epimerase [Acidobacteria bacterium]|nr:sugar phosphate isomerase/epimerase [Acidobacteriota bacterium]MCL5744961.1 sugar phosphate isomerase/epimerase [Acidobacteriota bacterium]